MNGQIWGSQLETGNITDKFTLSDWIAFRMGIIDLHILVEVDYCQVLKLQFYQANLGILDYD